MPRPKRVQPDSAVAAETGALADRLRAALPAEGRSEQKMFGGIGFMLNGNMVAGTSKRGLLLRVGKERYEDALSRPRRPPHGHAQPAGGGLRLRRPRGPRRQDACATGLSSRSPS